MSNRSKAVAGIKQEESSTKQFDVNIIGCMTDCNFYIPDETADNTGLAFRVAYHFAVNSKNNKEICACVGSMLCSVVPGFKNSVLEALNATGINPCFVSLPSQAHQNSIVDSDIPQLDWPSILALVGCDPSKELGIPFHFKKAYAISTMLGSFDLRDTVKNFVKNWSSHPNSQIRKMCEMWSSILEI